MGLNISPIFRIPNYSLCSNMLSFRFSPQIITPSFGTIHLSKNCSSRYVIVCGLKGPRPRYPRVWKSRNRIGTISKSQKLVECMKPEFVPLNKLTTQSGPHKVRVKVIEKARPQSSAGKGKYQRLVLTDEIGNTMKATLFDQDIEAYENIIKINGTYEIANATVKPVPSKYQSVANEHQMSFNSNTIIQLVGQTGDFDEPHYHSIASLPRTTSSGDRVDILGVVLYVDPIREVNGVGDRKVNVQELVITDSSSSQVLTLSAWNDLAARGSTLLQSWADSFAVVGFVSLRPSVYKGFSLATTMSSQFISRPTGERVSMLRQWVANNKELLEERLAQVKRVRIPSIEKTILPIAEVLSKKATNIMQEERYWLRVKIPHTDYFELRPYIACSTCGKRTDATKGMLFKCNGCKKENCKALPKVSFTFDAMDDSGTIKLTTFADNVEKILNTPSADLYDMQKNEDVVHLHNITKAAEDVYFLAEIGPANSLSTNGVLKWVLKSISIE